MSPHKCLGAATRAPAERSAGILAQQPVVVIIIIINIAQSLRHTPLVVYSPRLYSESPTSPLVASRGLALATVRTIQVTITTR